MKGNNMSLSISGLKNSQSMTIYLCIEDEIKEIAVTNETMDNLLALYKEKILLFKISKSKNRTSRIYSYNKGNENIRRRGIYKG